MLLEISHSTDASEILIFYCVLKSKFGELLWLWSDFTFTSVHLDIMSKQLSKNKQIKIKNMWMDIRDDGRRMISVFPPDSYHCFRMGHFDHHWGFCCHLVIGAGFPGVCSQNFPGRHFKGFSLYCCSSNMQWNITCYKNIVFIIYLFFIFLSVFV